MKKGFIITLLLFFTLTLSSFGVHKFYMGIYQINYAPEKKMLQITSRLFVDDINKTLEKKFNRKFYFGSDKETAESVEFLKKYLAENFRIKINGQAKEMFFLSKEMDGDVLVCYLKLSDITKISSVEIFNSVLLDCFSEQQNVVHVMVAGTKKSLLFTESSTKQVLKY